MVVPQRSSTTATTAASKKNNNNPHSSTLSSTAEVQHHVHSHTHSHQRQQNQSDQPSYQHEIANAYRTTSSPIYMLDTHERSRGDDPSPYHYQHHHGGHPGHGGAARGPRVIVVEDLLVSGDDGNGVMNSEDVISGGVKVMRQSQSSTPISYVHSSSHSQQSQVSGGLQIGPRKGGGGRGQVPPHPPNQSAYLTVDRSTPPQGGYGHAYLTHHNLSGHRLGGETLTSLSSNPCSSNSSLANDIGSMVTTSIYQLIGDKSSTEPNNPSNHDDVDGRMLIIGSPNYRHQTPSLAASLHQHQLIGIGSGTSGGPISISSLTSSPYISCYDAATMGGDASDYSAYYQHYQPTQTSSSVQGQPGSVTDEEGRARAVNTLYGTLPPQQSILHPTGATSPTLSLDGEMDDDGSDTHVNGRRSTRSGRDSDGLGHTARTPPETLEWLSRNYEPCGGASLPRCTLYYQYLNHCHELDLEPVNAASFGKLIRSVFKGLKTRRLGTRGNSKYHYDGIRIKPNSPLVASVPPQDYGNLRMGGVGRGMGLRNARRIAAPYRSSSLYQPPTSAILSTGAQPSTYQLRPRTNSTISNSNGGGDIVVRKVSESSIDYAAEQPYSVQKNGSSAALIANIDDKPAPAIAPQSSPSLNNSGSTTTSGQMTPPSHPANFDSQMAAPGDGQIPLVTMPHLAEMGGDLEENSLNKRHVLDFIDSYSANCEAVLDCVKRLQFDSIESLWREFWLQQANCSDASGLGRVGEAEEEARSEVKRLGVEQQKRLFTLPQVHDFIQRMDLAFYQVLVEVLVPDVLRTVLSPRLSCQVRNFARNADQWMRRALEGSGGNLLPARLREMKLTAVRLFSNALTRYTSFNHLADAARAVLRNKEQIAQMYNDFCRVDFPIVHSQADWICGCDPQLVASIEGDFRENLRLQKNLDEWTEWMEAVVDQLLARFHDKPIEVLAKASKQFLLKWSFYSSMILRDVTYRSAQSFGSFHLIRLLYDEYMFFLVETRLAKATNQPVICVMAEQWKQNPLIEHELNDGELSAIRHGIDEDMNSRRPASDRNDDRNDGEYAPPDYENLIDAATELSEIIATRPMGKRVDMDVDRSDLDEYGGSVREESKTSRLIETSNSTTPMNVKEEIFS